MSDSVRPHGRQPTRLPRPWDSPGKNTRVGCYFLLQCMKVKSESEGVQSCPSLCNPMDCSLPPSMGFSRQEYWSWLPLPSPAVSSLRCLNKSSKVQCSFSRVRPPHIPPQPRPLHSRGRETQEEQLPFLPLPRTHYPLRATPINLSGLGQPKPFMMAFSVPSEVK